VAIVFVGQSLASSRGKDNTGVYSLPLQHVVPASAGTHIAATSSATRLRGILNATSSSRKITTAAMNGGIIRRHSVDAVLQCGG
jgi:hypothetical protein